MEILVGSLCEFSHVQTKFSQFLLWPYCQELLKTSPFCRNELESHKVYAAVLLIFFSCHYAHFLPPLCFILIFTYRTVLFSNLIPSSHMPCSCLFLIQLLKHIPVLLISFTFHVHSAPSSFRLLYLYWSPAFKFFSIPLPLCLVPHPRWSCSSLLHFPHLSHASACCERQRRQYS